jgi:hypothetical protein
MAHVKWLRDIEVIDHEFDGYQNAVSYRVKQDPEEYGTAVTRMEPRALLVPPGDPDFMSRIRVLRPGSHVLEGRAWSGWGAVTRVEVSADDGGTWWPADVEGAADAHAWQRFTATWSAEPGERLLRARAHDETGRVQPVEPGWNRGGFTNNADAPIRVVVLDE